MTQNSVNDKVKEFTGRINIVKSIQQVFSIVCSFFLIGLHSTVHTMSDTLHDYFSGVLKLTLLPRPRKALSPNNSPSNFQFEERKLLLRTIGKIPENIYN